MITRWIRKTGNLLRIGFEFEKYCDQLKRLGRKTAMSTNLGTTNKQALTNLMYNPKTSIIMKRLSFTYCIASKYGCPYFVMGHFKVIYRCAIAVEMTNDELEKFIGSMLPILTRKHRHLDVVCYRTPEELYFVTLKNPVILVLRKFILEPFLNFRHKHWATIFYNKYARIITVVIWFITIAIVYMCGCMMYRAF